MIGTKYTPELLAALAKTPHLRSMEIPTTPDGQRIASYTGRYTGERYCETTFFDVGDVEFSSEAGVVSVVEERHTGINTITSFSESCTPDEPWLVIVEPD